MSSPISNAATATSTIPDAEDKMEVSESGDVEPSATKEIGSSSPVPSNTLTAAHDATGSAAKNRNPSAANHLTAQTTATSTTTNKSSSSGPPSAVEFEPPVACVRRILKKTLPSSSNVGKDAVAAFARASGIFIIYLTACANDFARENRRQTITANDVLAAIKELEFDEFAPDLTAFLERYRELEKHKKTAKAKAAAERAKEANEEKNNEADGEGAAGSADASTDTLADASAADGTLAEKLKIKEDEGAGDDESTSPQSPKSKGEDEDDDDKTNSNDADGDVSMDQEHEGGNIEATATTSTTNNENGEEADGNDMAEEGNADDSDTNTMEE